MLLVVLFIFLDILQVFVLCAGWVECKRHAKPSSWERRCATSLSAFVYNYDMWLIYPGRICLFMVSIMEVYLIIVMHWDFLVSDQENIFISDTFGWSDFKFVAIDIVLRFELGLGFKCLEEHQWVDMFCWYYMFSLRIDLVAMDTVHIDQN